MTRTNSFPPPQAGEGNREAVEGATALCRPFNSVLVANRGEIATRIIDEARSFDLRTIAVYSEADRRASYLQSADERIWIGPAPAKDSYLRIDAIIDAAQKSAAEAVHPGYGFLAENADFAQAVIDAGLVWIGPSPSAMRAMGDKGNAKQIAVKCGVPTIPGYDGDNQTDARLLAEARKIGWPVLIKAALGGGGRGQRRVETEADFGGAIAAARREALSAFASDRLILERALDGVRHVEIQIISDATGNTVHFGERDCSTQRRNQKIIEEAPCIALTSEVRERMGAAAERLAKAVNYVNAGTVEFLLDQDLNFYFLEMNTRIQVEHPVTEMATGYNLIRLQFAVARGDRLHMSSRDVRLKSHAMEARICAEDPSTGFQPQTGTLSISTDYSATTRVHYRIDPGEYGPIEVSGDYDSMVAKVIARGATREEARTGLIAALRSIDALGLRNNRNYLLHLLDSDVFKAAAANTNWLTREPPYEEAFLDTRHGVIAALILARGAGSSWRSTGDRRCIVLLRERQNSKRFVVEGDILESVRLINEHELSDDKGVVDLEVNGQVVLRAVRYKWWGQWLHVWYDGCDALFEDVTYAPAEPKGTTGANVIRAPMAGRIVKVAAEPGAKVAKNQILIILEAMKMEHELRAAVDGVVQSVSVKPGDQVSLRQTLVTLSQA